MPAPSVRGATLTRTEGAALPRPWVLAQSLAAPLTQSKPESVPAPCWRVGEVRGKKNQAGPQRVVLPKESIQKRLWSQVPSLQGERALAQTGDSGVPLPPADQRNTKRAGGCVQLLPLLETSEMYQAEQQCIWYFFPHPGNGCPSHSQEQSQDTKVKKPPLSPFPVPGCGCPVGSQSVFLN